MMKDSYDFSKLDNIRKNPFAEHLKKNGHSTIIHYIPDDVENTLCDDELDFEEKILMNEYHKKSKI